MGGPNRQQKAGRQGALRKGAGAVDYSLPAARGPMAYGCEAAPAPAVLPAVQVMFDFL
jgi:hypothetical protein